jgi:uncharacterized membrane protein YuzA (DUF378 family)
MRILIDGKPVGTLAARQPSALVLSPQEGPVQGSVLTANEVSNACAHQSKRVFVILGSVTAGVVGLVLLDEKDRTVLAPFAAVVIVGALTALLYGLFHRRIGAFSSALDRQGQGLAPAGTPIRVDTNGLTVGAETFTWPSLAIEQAEIKHVSGGAENPDGFLVIERLSLVAGARVIAFDKAMLRNGPKIVDNAWRELRGPS